MNRSSSPPPSLTPTKATTTSPFSLPSSSVMSSPSCHLWWALCSRIRAWHHYGQWDGKWYHWSWGSTNSCWVAVLMCRQWKWPIIRFCYAASMYAWSVFVRGGCSRWRDGNAWTRWRLSGLTTLEIVLMRSVCWWRERRQVGGEGVSGGAGCLLRGICVHSGFLTVHKVKALSLKFSVGLKPRSVSTYIKTDTYELCMCVLWLFCQQMPPNWFPYEMAKLQKL